MFIKKVLKNYYAFLIKKSFTKSQATYQKKFYSLFQKSANFFHRVNIEIGLTPLPMFIFIFIPAFHNDPFIKKIREAYRHGKKI